MPIVGNGDLAGALREVDRPDRLYFVSGVSNSQETRESEYKRERDLLLDQRRDLYLVYISSLAIYYSDTRYTRHKLDMESMVTLNFPQYTIMRLGNIDWGTNPHTLINYLRDHPNAELRDEERYICTQDEFLHWVNLIPDFNSEMNITGKRMKVKEIYDEYC
jgi:hypothetical protein